MRGTDARAREHRDRELGDHAEVDRDAIALRDAERLERVGDATRLREHVGVGEDARVAGLALPVERDLVAVTGGDVAVEAVVRDVEPAADEPLRERQVPVEDLRPLLLPIEGQRLTGPEALPVAFGLVVELGLGDQRLLPKRLRRRERAPLLEQSLERLRHASPSVAVRTRGYNSHAYRKWRPEHHDVVAAEAGGVGEGRGLRGAAARLERGEITDGGAFLPEPATLVEQAGEPSSSSHADCVVSASTTNPASTAAWRSCSTTTSATRSREPGSVSGPPADACPR